MGGCLSSNDPTVSKNKIARHRNQSIEDRMMEEINQDQHIIRILLLGELPVHCIVVRGRGQARMHACVSIQTRRPWKRILVCQMNELMSHIFRYTDTRTHTHTHLYAHRSRYRYPYFNIISILGRHAHTPINAHIHTPACIRTIHRRRWVRQIDDFKTNEDYPQ